MHSLSEDKEKEFHSWLQNVSGGRGAQDDWVI